MHDGELLGQDRSSLQKNRQISNEVIDCSEFRDVRYKMSAAVFHGNNLVIGIMT